MDDLFSIDDTAEATNPETRFPEEEVDDPQVDNPANDRQGAVRNWKNWVNPTFSPLGSNVQSPPGPIYKAVQISPGLNTLSPQSINLDQFLSQLQRTGALFEDPQFPATFQSLMGFGEARKDRTEKYNTYTWERPAKATGNKHYTVCGPMIGPQDLKQGKLGNCYFIAAIAAISEFPDRIRRIIKIKQPSQFGINSVSLHVGGLWEDVIIDDRIPYNLEKKRVSFCRSLAGDLWVMLIEKAWAKVHGGYSNIEAGYINEALAGLTGAPVKIFRVNHENEDEAWEKLLESKNKNYITCASTSDISKVVSEIPNDKTGLAGGHAYSLLAALEINYRGSTVRLVKLRNPWGKGEWKGDWGDNSPLWTPELKAHVGVTNKDDGIFHMTFKDAGKYFHDFAICHYRDNYVSSAKKFLTSPELPTIFGFNIEQPGEYYFKLHQISKRVFRKNDMYKYSALTVIIAKVEQNQLVYVGNASRARDQTWVLANCSPGSYFAYITTPWKRDCNTMAFSIYGPALVDFNTYEPNYLPPNFVETMMLDCARKSNLKKKDFTSKNEPDIYHIRGRPSSLDEMTFYYFCNKSTGTTFKVTTTIKTKRDVEILPPFNGPPGTVYVNYLDPGQEKIIIARQDGPDPKISVENKFGFKKYKKR